MKKIDLKNVLNINNKYRLDEINNNLNQLSKNIIPCKISNKLFNGEVRNHRGERFLLKDGSSLINTETTKPFTRYLDINTNKINLIKNTFSSSGNINTNKIVFVGPLSYAENLDLKFNDLKSNRPFYNQDVNYNDIKNLRKNEIYINNTLTNHLKCFDSQFFESNSEGMLISNNKFNTFGDFIKIKESELPGYYLNIHYDIKHFILDNPQLFYNLNIIEKENILRYLQKYFFNFNDINNIKNILKKVINDESIVNIFNKFD